MITFFLELYDQFLNYISGVDFKHIILALKILGWLVSFTLLFLIYILLKRSDATWWMKERAYSRQISYGEPTNLRWQKIQERLQRGDEANLKLAVIEANNTFGEILERMALPGKDMGERLRQFERHELKSVDLVWEAYKLRTQIVHDPNIHIAREQAEEAVSGIGEALKELEYL